MSNQPTQPSEQRTSDIQSLMESVKEKPGVFIGSVVFILAIALAAILFQLNSVLSDKAKASEYAFALDEETPSERSIALAAVADSDSPYSMEALYLSGVSAFEAKDYDAAIVTLARIRTEHSDFQFAPDAVSVIGMAHEALGEYEEAIEQYQSIQSSWPESFAARVQANNLGRCYEHLENIADAIKAYQEQLAAFPGSYEAQRAQGSLSRLRAIHPEAFETEDEEPEVDPALITGVPEITENTEPEQN
jgi:tetratricopeptide (TPR) repeat protein